MDKTVIQEIANQLGIGADRAGDFITTYLPQYAALRTWQEVFSVAFAWFLAALLAIALAAVVKAKARAKAKAGDDWRYSDKESYDTAIFAIACIASGFLVFAIINTAITVPNIIGWSTFPEAQLISEATRALGR